MINTVFRLFVFVPAALLAGLASFASLQSGGIGFLPFLFWAAVAAVAIGLIAWTISDRRKRMRLKRGFDA